MFYTIYTGELRHSGAR